MNHIFEPYLKKFVLVFFDDILVCFKNWLDHMLHLEVVFETLLHYQLFVKYNKCDFGATHIEYLGHVISHQGVAMDDSKVSCILQWPYPRLVKDLRGFLGLTGYYC